jgi:hypothetical protein
LAVEVLVTLAVAAMEQVAEVLAEHLKEQRRLILEQPIQF